MNCEEVQLQLLMQCDEFGAPDGVVGRDCGHAGVQDAAVREHVATCEACAALAGKLRRLESAVRSLPAPMASESSAARERFEAKLDVMFAPAVVRRSRQWWARPQWVGAAAAALLLAIGGAAWVHHANETRAVASAGTIEELVDWNLKLAQKDDPAERERLYRESAANLQQKLGSAKLTDDEKQVADALMQDGAMMAKDSDPLADADRFSHVADLLVNRMGHAAKKSPQALDQLGESYLLVVDRGIKRNLDRAEATGAPTTQPVKSAVDSEEHQKRIERILQRNLQIQKKLENLLEQTSDTAKQRPLKKALDATRQQRPVQAKKELKKQERQLERQQQQQQGIPPNAQ